MIVYLDTLALLYRAYYAVPGLTAKDGTPTGALYGLTNSLFRIIAELEPDHIIACFDRPEQTVRQDLDSEYKANREAPEEDMIVQIECARSMLESYGVHIVEKAGYEADDLLGTLATTDADRGESVVIVSCDGDLLQLTVHPNVRVYFLRKGMGDFVLYDEEEVEKKNGYPARHIIDYKGLAGDSSDNIIGVPGIGDTFAKRLVNAFGDIDAIYAALEDGALVGAGFTKRVENLLRAGKESAFSSRDLATIHTDVPVSLPHIRAEKWRDRIIFANAREVLEQYSFESLVKRLSLITGREGEKGFDSSPAADQKNGGNDMGGVKISSPEDQEVAKKASVALWVLDATQTNATAEEVLVYTDTKTLKDALSHIEESLKEQGRLQMWEEIEKPLIPIIENMKSVGILFDRVGAKKLSVEYHKKISSLQKKIHTHAKKEFNIKSPKQLGEVLYKDLGLKPKRSAKTAGGAKTTKESVLLGMLEDHPIISLILEYRHYEKLRSTYVDALPEYLDEQDRIHTTLHQNGTITGRFSSSDPNLQNIPIAGEDGTAIRNLFIATDGWEMVSIDYSQIELRIAAILSQDKTLLDLFAGGSDIHRAVAAQMFSVSENAVSAEQRNSAKAINFGILYGMGAQSLQRSLGVSRTEAETFLNEHKKAFPVLFEFLEGIKGEARTSGSVTTIFGRVRPIPGISSSLAFVRAQAERMAVNSVMQGANADIIKIAMININKMIEKGGFRDSVRMVLQIHDELLFEILPSNADAVIERLVDCMESVYPPNKKPIPLLTNVKRGSAWGSLQ